MYRLGHVGLALLVLSGVSVLLGLPFYWILWLCAAGAIIAPIPDWDLRWNSHRGVTHSLFFLITVSVLCGVVTSLVLPHVTQVLPQLQLSGFYAFMTGFGPVAGGLGTHLLGDVCTYSGIPLLWPAKRRYSLRLCSSSSLRVNLGLGLAGFAAFLLLVVAA